jgi:hypothetical protein
MNFKLKEGTLGIWKPANYAFGHNGWDPSVSKSNRLHIAIFRFIIILRFSP